MRSYARRAIRPISGAQTLRVAKLCPQGYTGSPVPRARETRLWRIRATLRYQGWTHQLPGRGKPAYSTGLTAYRTELTISH